MFLIGAVFAAFLLGTTENKDGQYDLPLRFFGAPIAVSALSSVTPRDWRIGFFDGAIPQIPLTTLNSVISVCTLAHCLYPEKRKQTINSSKDAVLSRREVAISVGLINLILCPFGSMPNCHGAGGLAGQHKMGARHGASVVFLGGAKMFLSIFFGASALTLLDAFPTAILGVMIVISGQELATTGLLLLVADVDEMVVQYRISSSGKKSLMRQSIVISTITSIVIVSTGKTHYGVLTGWVAHMIYGNGTADLLLWIRLNWRNHNEKRESETSCHSENNSCQH